jgi:hypothetical protein
MDEVLTDGIARGDWAISMDLKNLCTFGIEGLCMGFVWILVRTLRGTSEVVVGSG